MIMDAVDTLEQSTTESVLEEPLVPGLSMDECDPSGDKTISSILLSSLGPNQRYKLFSLLVFA